MRIFIRTSEVGRVDDCCTFHSNFGAAASLDWGESKLDATETLPLIVEYEVDEQLLEEVFRLAFSGGTISSKFILEKFKSPLRVVDVRGVKL